jgi:hypothetical protein
MGGLVIKEVRVNERHLQSVSSLLTHDQAYLVGQNDPQYEYIIKAIMAITFLATPHRGTNLATILNWILTSTFLSNT